MMRKRAKKKAARKPSKKTARKRMRKVARRPSGRTKKAARVKRTTRARKTARPKRTSGAKKTARAKRAGRGMKRVRGKARGAGMKSARASKRPSRAQYTITLSEPYGHDIAPKLSVSGKDQVRWKNDTDVDREIAFTVWVFKGPKKNPFTVLAGGTSSWYTLKPGTITGRSYGYAVSPAFQIGPPDPPQVSADD